MERLVRGIILVVGAAAVGPGWFLYHLARVGGHSHEQLLRVLPWVLVPVLLVVSYAFVDRETGPIVVAAFTVSSLVSVLYFVKKGASIERWQETLAQSDILEVDKMPGQLFEEHLGVVFSCLGYSVTRTRVTGDYGADLVLDGAEGRVVVQAKRYSKSVGVKAVQEVKAAMSVYGASHGMVVTNSYFTRQAIELASKNSIELRDRNWLVPTMAKVARSRRSQ